MAEFAFRLEPAPALGCVDRTIVDNRIVERDDFAIVSLATPIDGEPPLAEALKRGWGLALPGPTTSTVKDNTRLIRTAPDQMLLVFPHDTPDAELLVRERLGETSYTTDQTGAWVVLEISGPDTGAALERLSPVDMSRMPQDGSARTVMDHIGVLAVRTGSERVMLMSARSSAGSFLRTIDHAFVSVTH